MIQQRKCSLCKIEKPMTTEYFHAARKHFSGFQHYCKLCKKKKDKEYHSTDNNVKPCCEQCNKMKMGSPVDTWLNQCKKIVKYNKL